MGTEQYIVNRMEEDDKLAGQLKDLEKLLEQSENLRHQHFFTICISLLLMLVILTFFVISLIAFFRAYPKRALVREIFDQTRNIVYSTPNPDHGMDSRYSKIFMEEFKKSLKVQLPVIYQEVRSSIRALNKFMTQDLKHYYRDQLYKRLQEITNQYLAKKKIIPDPATRKNLELMNQELAVRITDNLFRQFEEKRWNAQALQKELQYLEDSERGKQFEASSLAMLENRFYEALFDCWICQMNAGKGMLPADQEVSNE